MGFWLRFSQQNQSIDSKRCEDIDDCALLLYGCLGLGRALLNGSRDQAACHGQGKKMTWPSLASFLHKKAHLDDFHVYLCYIKVISFNSQHLNDFAGPIFHQLLETIATIAGRPTAASGVAQQDFARTCRSAARLEWGGTQGGVSYAAGWSMSICQKLNRSQFPGHSRNVEYDE